ncbi:ACT domain-containing protein [Dysgonomonas sp. 520]|uniref:ACT domain-containing protein n=1 Tax=Dysgonomonas sp. 520 TaxID=2302931 RepID=UPI0013D7D0AD|nr:ACT domain-containing protein [Dysgonomonas sp. 520]NDW09256.1 amino acid-binding protein [Dysgonomonas sp. 520]
MTIRQLSVFIENKTGRINDVTRILAANGVNMTAFSLAESSDFGILRMIISDVDLAVRVLKDAHFGVSVTDVVCFACDNTPGSLSKILEYLAKEDVFIEYMYAFSQGESANVVIRPTDVNRCVEILKKYDCNLLTDSHLH